MKIKQCLFLFISVFTIILSGCQDILDQEKYQPPEWLKGKIFTQIREEEDLGTYISILKKTGYDKILDASGSYTVFAPTDKAFEEFFTNYPDYRILFEADETSDKLNSLVEGQIIFNAWSKKQFRTLDINGWIDPKDELSEPRGYKRQTLFHQGNKSYPAMRKGNKFQIVDISESGIIRKAYTESNKYCPIFFTEYFETYGLRAEDYEFYFNRPFDPAKLYFEGAEFEDGISAENGFIYKTDKVVLPIPNGEELLEAGNNSSTYESFLNLIYQFSEFSMNLEATYNQPGAEQGLEIDTLYNLDYPDLAFNISNELTGNSNNQKFTVREHHGLVAPSDRAFSTFVNEYLSVWGGLQGTPAGIKKIIVNSHLFENALYPSYFNKGILNGEGDVIFLDESDIIQKNYGSNCTFLGLNKTIIPRVFKSICRPIYSSKDFEIMMSAIEQTNVISALKKPDVNYAFYLPSDKGIGPGGDSSLVRVIEDFENETYHFMSLDLATGQTEKRDIIELRKSILNQISFSPPEATANKEFLRNLGGNYIIANHMEGTVSGSSPTTLGYNGSEIIHLIPELYQEETDNGIVYIVDTWFSFQRRNFFVLFQTRYPEFLALLRKAGLYDSRYNEFPFLIDGEYYTVFIPTAQALNEYGIDTLSKNELGELLKYHFVLGELIFTDNKKPDGYYSTALKNPSSAVYTNQYRKLYIRTEPDLIEILDKKGDVYLEVHEDEDKTNIMVTYDSNNESPSIWDHITIGAVHEIDRVLIIDSLKLN